MEILILFCIFIPIMAILTFLIIKENNRKFDQRENEKQEKFTIQVYSRYFVPCYFGEGIEKRDDDFYLWSSNKLKIKNCSVDTREEAEKIIDEYKNSESYMIENIKKTDEIIIK